MNRIFNIIWSRTKEKWIVVSEHVKGNGKVPSSPLRSLAVLTALFSVGRPAYAIDPGSLPTEGQITSGIGTITTSGTQMTVNQSSQQMIANWSTFNIGENAAVRFNQPGVTSTALNRITDRNPSQIMGSLSSNGQVFLLNSSGIIFGRTARVDVGGLVASSLNMLDSDFLAGKYTFIGTGSSGVLLNQGVIKARDGGVVALMAPKVTNEGSITANSGSVLLAAGNKVSLDFTGDGLISYTVDQGAVDALVENRGLIKADGGLVVMTSRAADALRMATTTNSGVIEAHTIQNKAGRILLLSDMANGQTNVGGTLDASAPNSGDGGFIETSAGRVRISDGTIVTTLAPKGKTGTWLIDPPSHDFTIAATDGDMTGATLSLSLSGLTNVDIISSNGVSGSAGNINVNDVVTWNKNKLTLTATNDININAVMTASDTASLDLEPGSYKVNMGFNPDGTFKGRVDFFQANGTTPRSGTGFLTINTHGYTVITDLGAYDSTTGTDLQGIKGSLSGYYALGSNIDASPTAFWNSDGAPAPTYAGFLPIGSGFFHFDGTFDGLGHTISNLTINRPGEEKVGLFGNSHGTIRNVALVDASVTGNSSVGGLVGFNYSGITSNSYATGIVVGNGNYVGGLVGWNEDVPITNSHASVNVTGKGDSTGGLVGHHHNSAISNSSATGNVVGYGDYAGGLVGHNDSGTISNSYATGTVTGQHDSTGGLVGRSDSGTINNSYATGNVVGYGDYAGGLLGHNDGIIENSYATGNVVGYADYVGALVGINDTGNTINNSYATGNVVGHGDYVGGLAGSNYGDITNSYARGVVTGSGSDVGGLVGDNYGTISNSYAMGEVTGSADYVGGLVGYSYGSISNSFATGSVVGNGNHVGGLAGLLHHLGTISNSYSAGSVKGGDYVGGLVGTNWNGGTISNSYATGSVEGSSYVGGLAGENFGTIEKSYARGVVTGSGNDIGGLVGYNHGTIENTYATGDVTGSGDNVGGLVGINYATITNSYARGRVTGSNYVGGLVGFKYGFSATHSNSFYESDANPLLKGVGNSPSDVAGQVWGLSTANMKLLANFTTSTAANGNVNPGWDFTPDTGIWKIDAAKNGGYPYLAWQMLSPDISEIPYERPVLSEPLPVTNPSYQGASIAPTGPLIPEGQILEVKIVNPPSGSAPGLILVMVPQSLALQGFVFSFVLPEEVKNAVSESGVAEKVTLLDGSPLPSWLHYNSETMTFTAMDMPQGVTELKILVTVGGKSWIVDITMQHAP